ncbi:prophage protein (fragment) [Escherichia coli]
MNSITKERIELFIKNPLENGLTRGEQMELARIALASLAAVSDERAAYELFMEKRFGESVDRRRAKNGDREYMAWDMALGWIIWCHRTAMLQCVEPASNHEELSEENGASLQLRNLIRQRHAEWSDKTFGCVGPVGPLKHLSKEALEAAAEPDDLSEWADMQFLLWDAQRRAGISDAEITAAMEDKLKINMERQWPEPKDGEPRLHIKEHGNSPVTTDGWISCSERMPEKNQNVLISVNFDSSLVEPLICSARYTGSTFRRGDATIKPGNGIEQATHWMPLPEPPQEAK